MTQRRGLAYAEYNSQWVWQAANVLASNLVLACAAEYSRKLEDPEAASEAQERLVRACFPTQIES